MAPPKILIIGGGFAGLNTAKSLKGSSAEIILIDRTNHHLFQPLLYQVATAGLSPGNIAAPLRWILKKQKNLRVLLEEVLSVNKMQRTVTLKSGHLLSFDYLILAPGARHSYFGNESWEVFAPGLKTIQDALTIREKMLLSFERAEMISDKAEQKKHLTFVIVGAGPTGVEMAGAIAEIAKKTLREEFRCIQVEETRVLLLDVAERVLPVYPASLSEKAFLSLKDLGVEIRLKTRVTNITSEGIQAGDEWIPSANIIWAAGNVASPLLKTLETDCDRAGRVIVQPDLSIPQFPNIFVLGDGAHCKNNKGEILPGIAPVAIQQGKYLGKLLQQILKTPEAPRKPFFYKDRGTMATIGRARAVAQIYAFRFSGWLAWLTWSLIHIFFLIGFRSRFSVMMEWFWYYITYHRTARLITHLDPSQKPPIPKT